MLFHIFYCRTNSFLENALFNEFYLFKSPNKLGSTGKLNVSSQLRQLKFKYKNKYPFRKIVDPVFDFTKQGLEDAFNSLNSKKSLRPAIRPSL